MSEQRVVIVGYYGFGNAGDEALLLSVLQMLPKALTPVVLSADPEATTAEHGVIAIDRWDWRAIASEMKQAVGFIWGGGSLMQDRTSWRSPLYYGTLMLWAQRQGLRTVAWAQGIGPLQRGWCRWLTRRCLQGCVAVSVRDRESAALLEQWQIPHHCLPDPVWALTAIAPPQSQPTIAINLRPHPELTPARLALIKSALPYLQELSGAELVSVAFQDRDRAMLPELTHVSSAHMPYLASVNLVIAMRLHAVIMAAAVGTPVWGLSYDPKVTQVLAQYELDGCELADLPPEPQALAEQWYAAYQDQKSLSQTARSAIATEARKHEAVLVPLLGVDPL